MMQFDTSELRAFAASLGRAGSKLPSEARKVATKGALNIKNQMNADLAGSTHFGSIAGSVNFDIKGGGSSVEAEIGPDKPGPGALANVAFFGTSRGGGTVADPQVALDAEAPRFVEALADAMERAIE